MTQPEQNQNDEAERQSGFEKESHLAAESTIYADCRSRQWRPMFHVEQPRIIRKS
jgi:hypothetical protein